MTAGHGGQAWGEGGTPHSCIYTYEWNGRPLKDDATTGNQPGDRKAAAPVSLVSDFGTRLSPSEQ